LNLVHVVPTCGVDAVSRGDLSDWQPMGVF
jgi:hypothetical protein